MKIMQGKWRLYSLDTGHKLNAHKTFRRRPGRLLNVLCAFILRPVSTGYTPFFLLVFHMVYGSNTLCGFTSAGIILPIFADFSTVQEQDTT